MSIPKDSFIRGYTLVAISPAMMIEHIGSAIIQPACVQ